MSGPEHAVAAVTGTQLHRQQQPPWWQHSLAFGLPGIALLHIELARHGFGAWSDVHDIVTGMAAQPINAHPDRCSLFQGAPAVAFVLHAAADAGGDPRYAALAANLDQRVRDVTAQRLQAAHRRIDLGHLPAVEEFDLISGLTGLGVALLSRHLHEAGHLPGDEAGHAAGHAASHAAGHRSAREPGPVERQLRQVLSYVVRLTLPVRRDGEEVPGWWSPHAPRGVDDAGWGGGHVGLGMAHGVAGPLALLSTAMRHHVVVAGHGEAIERICAVFDRWRRGSGHCAWWPAAISADEWRSATLRRLIPPRPSWCYGTPGIVRAQQLAGLALGDPVRQHQAEKALLGCVSDDTQTAQLSDASLCHGWAGLVHTVRRVTADAAPHSGLLQQVPRLQDRLSQHEGGDHDGFLEGRSGLRLAHLAATARVARDWDRCLLLTG